MINGHKVVNDGLRSLLKTEKTSTSRPFVTFIFLSSSSSFLFSSLLSSSYKICSSFFMMFNTSLLLRMIHLFLLSIFFLSLFIHSFSSFFLSVSRVILYVSWKPRNLYITTAFSLQMNGFFTRKNIYNRNTNYSFVSFFSVWCRKQHEGHLSQAFREWEMDYGIRFSRFVFKREREIRENSTGLIIYHSDSHKSCSDRGSFLNPVSAETTLLPHSSLHSCSWSHPDRNDVSVVCLYYLCSWCCWQLRFLRRREQVFRRLKQTTGKRWSVSFVDFASSSVRCRTLLRDPK